GAAHRKPARRDLRHELPRIDARGAGGDRRRPAGGQGNSEPGARAGRGGAFRDWAGHLALALALAATGHVEQAAPAAARAVQLSRRGAGRLEIGLALATHAQTLLTAGQDGLPMLAEAKRVARACRDPGWLPDLLTRLGRAMT